ncbi:sulfatase, putative [Verrucomicrobiia bacterium DG1235]|nr:sulfatase, putative [Verrucomicrobiae bacterium DG1235]
MNLINYRSSFRVARSALVIASLLIPAFVSIAETSLRKNVMIIMVDDLRPQLKGFGPVPSFHGATQMHTPALDTLGAQGTIFERAYCAVPICGASRLSLLTGSRPYKEPGQNWGRHWTFYSRLDAADQDTPAGVNHPGVTLPQHFKNSGYTLHSIGKVYHNRDDDREVWDDMVKLQHPWRDVPAFEIGVGEKNDDDSYPDGLNASDVIAKLDGLKDDPFLYCVGFPRPHLPFWAPKKYWDLYPEESIKLPPNYSLPVNAPRQSIHNWGELRNYTEVEYADEAESKLSDEYARTMIRGYYATVSYVDAQIERIVDKLKNTYDSQGVSLFDKTILVVWGDHGWNLGEHTLWAKHALYNTSTQIPLIIRDPDFPGGQRVSSLVESVDLYPTLCDLVGIGRPETTIDNDDSVFNLHGSSLLPLLKDPESKWKPAVFTRFIGGDSVRTKRYSFTEFTNQSDQVVGRMLYDLKYDPAENYNIADLNADLVSRLSHLLGATPVEKRNAWRALVDETRNNEPLEAELNLPEARHPDDYFKRLSENFSL